MTTKQKIQLFKDAIYFYIDYFGLKRYEVSICEQIKSSAQASLYGGEHDDTNNNITISYSLDWINEKDLTEEDIKSSSFHEVLELFFYEIRNVMEYRYITKEEPDRVIHNVIRTLENTMFKEHIKNKLLK